MRSIMTEEETMSSGQKNRAPKGGGIGPVSVRQAPSPGLWSRFRAPSCRNGPSVDHGSSPFMSP